MVGSLEKAQFHRLSNSTTFELYKNANQLTRQRYHPLYFTKDETDHRKCGSVSCHASFLT